MVQKKIRVLVFPAIFNSVKALSSYIDIGVLYVHPEESIHKNFLLEVDDFSGLTVRVFVRRRKSKFLFFKLLNGLLYVIAVIKGYRQITKMFGRADLNHVQVLTRTALLPLCLRLFVNVPFLITERWSRYLSENRRYTGGVRKLVTNYALKKSIGLSTVSYALKNALRDCGLYHPNTSVIPNAVDIDRFFPSYSTNRGKVMFLHASCFHDDAKNIKGLLKAAHMLDTSGYSFSLNIAGSGRDFEEVFAFAKGLSFSNVELNFHGELVGQSLVELFQQSTAFILFSNYETQGSVILEAFCCGVPVIGSNVGGIPEFVNDKNGILVEPGNIDELKNAMLKFIKGQVTYDKQEIRNYAVANYSFDAIAKRYIEFYNSALLEDARKN